MKLALAVFIFVVVVVVATAGRWYGMRESLTMYGPLGKPRESHRFSLSTLLVAAIGLAVGFGLFVIWLRRS